MLGLCGNKNEILGFYSFIPIQSLKFVQFFNFLKYVMNLFGSMTPRYYFACGTFGYCYLEFIHPVFKDKFSFALVLFS